MSELIDAIECRQVSKVFDGSGRSVTAIDGLSLSVKRGEYVCILGRSGCGKSTTVNLLLGLSRPTSGQVRVLGVDPAVEFATLRGRVACVFQSDRLLPWRSALANVQLPLEILGVDEAKLAISPQDWLERLDLGGVERAFPHELSGGMRQRVAIARALASDPDVLLADEAFGHLDEVTGARLRQDFRTIARAGDKTVLHITHSIEEALSVSDRIVVLGKPGRVLDVITNVQALRPEDRAAARARILTTLEQGNGEPKVSVASRLIHPELQRMAV